MSRTLPMSPSLASRRLVNHPPSFENPMFIIACKATCILGLAWKVTVDSEAFADAEAADVDAEDADVDAEDAD